MRVEDFDYEKKSEDDEIVNLTEDRKRELISKIKDEIKDGHIALYKVLKIQKNNTELDFLFDWLEENEIELNGINSSLSGEKENYNHIPKMRQSIVPEPLAPEKQHELLVELDKLKQKGITNKSEEYRAIRNELLEHNMRLAQKIVAESYGYYKSFGLEINDMKQYAMEALIKAVEKFDVNKGFKFSSYATPTIRNGVMRGWINESKEHQMPQESRLVEFRMAKKTYEEKFNKELTDIEFLNLGRIQLEDGKAEIDILRDLLGIEEGSIKTFENYVKSKDMVSLDELIQKNEFEYNKKLDNIANIDENNGKDRYSHIIVSQNGVNIESDELPIFRDDRNVEDTAIKSTLKDIMNKNIETLTPRESEVIRLRFGFDGKGERTLKEVAEKIGRSSERIRQIEIKAERKLRHPMRSRHLKDYVDNFTEGEIYIIDDETPKGQIVDGIKIEKMSEIKTKKVHKKSKSIKEKENKDIKLEEVKDEPIIEQPKNEKVDSINIDEIKKAFEKSNEIKLNKSEDAGKEENEDILDELYEEDEVIQTDEEIIVQEETQPREVHEKIQPQEVQEEIQPQEIREEIQPQEIREEIQPQEVQEEIQEESSKSESEVEDLYSIIEAKLKAIEELNKMIKENLQEIEDEKEKRQKNQELRGKIKEVNDLIK